MQCHLFVNYYCILNSISRIRYNLIQLIKTILTGRRLLVIMGFVNHQSGIPYNDATVYSHSIDTILISG